MLFVVTFSSGELRPAIAGGIPTTPPESFALRLWEGYRHRLWRASSCVRGRDAALSSRELRPATVGGMPVCVAGTAGQVAGIGFYLEICVAGIACQVAGIGFYLEYVLRASDVKVRASVFTRNMCCGHRTSRCGHRFLQGICVAGTAPRLAFIEL